MKIFEGLMPGWNPFCLREKG